MSDTTASLRRKIDGARDLQSVVRTMKTLAASSIGQYEQSVRSLADYYRTVERGLAVCIREADPAVGAATRRRRRISVNAIVFGSDQGLVGQFNDVVAAFAIEALAGLPGKPQVWAVGERVHARLADAGLSVRGLFAVPSSVEGIAPLVAQIQVQSEPHSVRDADTDVYVFHNRPRSGALYEPVSQRLVPLDEPWRRGLAKVRWPTTNLPETLNGIGTTLRALVREYLFISLFKACAESLASENASRLTAMDRADRNIDELLDNLRGTFGRLRQDKIDEELFDVVSGFEALVGP